MNLINMVQQDSSLGMELISAQGLELLTVKIGPESREVQFPVISQI